jgi:hypothetical protein
MAAMLIACKSDSKDDLADVCITQKAALLILVYTG